MQKKRRNIFWYFLAPIIVEWIISFVVQIGAEIVYIMRDVEKLMRIMESGTGLVEYMDEMIVVLNQHATEITTFIAVFTFPFLLRMYNKDKADAKEWWDNRKEISGRTVVIIGVLAVSVCIAANNFILLSGISSQSEAYVQTSQIIYESPIFIQFIGLGILIPMMEEMIYRGLLYRRMREYLPMSVSILGTALLFGLYHGNFVQLLFATVIGVFLAYLFEIFHSVKVPILFHVIVNITSLICTWTGAFKWIFSSFFTVSAVTVIACVTAAGMIMFIKYYENVK